MELTVDVDIFPHLIACINWVFQTGFVENSGNDINMRKDSLTRQIPNSSLKTQHPYLE
ncbi:hypothetical protein BDK88_4407 [Natrinema hispanicum]|uniref:Uncharacterized protein n=1 Tax=Natrinema hispanicum TaxID=392421 RepID=A0A1I0HPY3_9EURY|nr:hypothetical protein BDK88_4407 [Natrinema hispanicum]SET85221.1 hypothetical protein SAMN04488694_11458 [Natrinema hispanicum]